MNDIKSGIHLHGAVTPEAMAGDAGCGVYEDRPTACRDHPVARLARRRKDASEAQERYTPVKEAHCKAHEEPRPISIADTVIPRQADDA